MLQRQMILFSFFAFLFSIAQLNASELRSAGSSPWVSGKAGASQVRLLSQYLQVGETTPTVLLGLEFKLKDRWHVYWKNPGEVGFPPRLNWTLPSIWQAGPLLFPRPERIKVSVGEAAFGYSKSVIYPLFLNRQPTDVTSSDRIQVTVDYLVCDVQCIPERAELALTLPVRTSSLASPFSSILERAYDSVPKEADSKLYDLQWVGSGGLELTWKGPSEIRALFHYSPDLKAKDWSVERISGRAFQFQWPQSAQVSQLEFVVVTDTNETATIIIQNDSQPAAQSSTTGSLWTALLLAFLGGLILNLMPCVLPVLVLKSMSLLKLTKEQSSRVRISLLWTVLGILSSFVALAAVVIFLKASGEQVGWGFHFQSPVFVSFMALVIFLFSLNLLGVFEFQLSARATTKLHDSSSHPFFEGVFATLLATPCSAPFLGTALAYALAQTSAVLTITFLVMGLGLSTPYLLFILAPNALKLLPRPGPWMNTLKRVLGYSLLIAFIWLSSVLIKQATPLVLILVLGAATLLTVVLLETKGLTQTILVALMLALSLVGIHRFTVATAQSATENQHFQTEADLEKALREGKNLYVVVTADWCLTCKYNETFVMKAPWFQSLLKENGIEVLMIDWTSRNENIGRFLEKHGRVGIPFSMFASARTKVLLPELLTENNVREALKQFQQKN